MSYSVNVTKEYIQESQYHGSWWLAERKKYPVEFEAGVYAYCTILENSPATKEGTKAYEDLFIRYVRDFEKDINNFKDKIKHW